MSMRLSARYLLLADNDGMRRMSRSFFEGMLRGLDGHRVPALAGRRVRAAEIVVEIVDRKAIRVVRAYFSYLSFDADGRFDQASFGRAQIAKMNAMLRRRGVPDASKTVIDASPDFVARGGAWKPTRAEEMAIYDAALGERSAPYIGR